MELKIIKQNLHQRILNLRAVESIVGNPQFERLYDQSDPESQYEVKQHIIEGRREALKNWMACHPSLELGEFSHNYLKKLGMTYSIPSWSRLTKPELLTEIQQWEDRHGQVQTR